MSFQKVVKLMIYSKCAKSCFRTVSFQKVVKHRANNVEGVTGFRTVSFQKVVKLLSYLS